MKAKLLVLVVEDETLIRMVAAEIAAEADFDVISVANADEAIVVLEGGVDVRVVFTDIHMPGSMDGLGLARSVHERWPPVGLIVTSGRGEVGKDELPEGGRFLLKPYDECTLKKPSGKLSDERRFAAGLADTGRWDMNVKAIVVAAVAPFASWRCWRPLRRKLIVAEEVSALRTLGNAKGEVPPDKS